MNKTIDFIIHAENEVRELEPDENPTLKEMRTIKKRAAICLDMKEWEEYMSLQGEDRGEYLKSLIK